MHTRARAEVDNMIGGEYGFLVMLDDDYRVARIAQVNECVEQPFVVALMQADRRLVQNVHDADESGADLARQADTLCFAAGQRIGAAIERQVIEANVRQKTETMAYFLDDFVGNRGSPAVELHGLEKFSSVAYRQVCYLRKRASANENMSCRTVQARAFAIRTGLAIEEFR